MLNKKNVGKIVGVLFFCMFFIFGSVEAGLNNGFNRQPVVILSGDVFYVGGSGPDNYTSIQDAVDNASSGDTVFVFGREEPYNENVVVDKSIFLIGEDKNLVVIDAGFYEAAVTIIADDVFVSGFTMICFHDNPNLWDSELVDILSSENVTIRDNIIQQNKIIAGSDCGGVILRNSSFCFIQNNTIMKEKDGRPCWGVVLMLGSAFINVSGNEVYNYTGGIYFQGCSDNEIYMNYFHHNMDGIWINYGKKNIVINNIINFNTGEGIRIDDGYNNVISGNIITDNGNGGNIDRGIGLIGGSDNYISYNHISNNNPCGIHLIDCFNNNIIHNNFSYNKIGVFFDTGYKNYIVRNNFILNEKNGYFDRWISIKNRMIWKENYWDEPRTKPYPIFGIGYLPLISFRWVVFDWHPAQEPYDI